MTREEKLIAVLKAGHLAFTQWNGQRWVTNGHLLVKAPDSFQPAGEKSGPPSIEKLLARHGISEPVREPNANFLVEGPYRGTDTWGRNAFARQVGGRWISEAYFRILPGIPRIVTDAGLFVFFENGEVVAMCTGLACFREEELAQHVDDAELHIPFSCKENDWAFDTAETLAGKLAAHEGELRVVRDELKELRNQEHELRSDIASMRSKLEALK